MDFPITLIPRRELFADFYSNFRILSCSIVGDVPEGFELNEQYHNFTIQGGNLWSYNLNQETRAIVRPLLNSKYPCSYVVVGIPGLEYDNDKIHISPEAEYDILKSIMTTGQAKNILKAYPNFVQMILEGRESEIDHSKIFNVGQYRYEQYIEKIKTSCNSLLFIPACDSLGIKDESDVNTLAKEYSHPQLLAEDMEKRPYYILMTMLGWNFRKADALVMAHYPGFADTVERCSYSCYDILKQNENECGDTRLNANVMYRLMREETPECAHHIVEATTTSPLFHYDPDSKYIAAADTYEAEAKVAEVILERVKNPNPIHMDWTPFTNVDGFQITDEQVVILQLAGKHSVMMLTGSAGTGKSTSMKALIRMLEANGQSFTLVAPTGIAAKVMTTSTGRQATTIHRLLGYLQNDMTTIGDYLIIDETSMVSIGLMAKLFHYVVPKTKIIFVCDESQLASIDAGNLVQDILDSGIVPRANLTKVFRYGTGGISTVATDVRNGRSPDLFTKWPDMEFVPINPNPVEQILEVYNTLMANGYKVGDIMVMSPNKINRLGSYAINNAIQEKFNLNPMTEAKYKVNKFTTMGFKVGDKVMNVKNNYNAQGMDYDEYGDLFKNGNVSVVNGDIGYVTTVYMEDNGPIVVVQFDADENGCNRLVAYSTSDIGDLQLGYAITVHKSQGSQAKVVIFMADESQSNILSRNLMYVGLSRAQERLIMITDPKTVDKSIERQENLERDTWLKDMLKMGIVEEENNG